MGYSSSSVSILQLYRRRSEELWEYLAERQRIWVRREKGMNWPWTLDKVLQQWQFPNVYRELDTGTKYLREELIPQLEPGNTLLNLVAYRHFNTVVAAERLMPLKGPLPNDLKLRVAGINPYTRAYRTSPFMHLGGMNPIENSLLASQQWARWLPEVEQYLYGETMGATYQMLAEIQGVGPFVAYVICCDLTYTDLVNFTEDSDVFPHTGSLECLSWMIGHPVQRGLARILIRALQENSTAALEARDFHFLEGRPLSLRGIEDGLCELHRYRAIKGGSSSGRRYYPQAEILI
jgi:hypothetical protein